jgi:hypothetical protein
MQHVATAPESVRQNIAAAFFLIATAVSSQTAQQQHFEAASIKAGGDLFSIRPERTGGRIRWTTQLLFDCLRLSTGFLSRLRSEMRLDLCT